MPRWFFRVLYTFGLGVGIVLAFVVLPDQPYESFLLWFGIGHMSVLITVAFGARDKAEAGVDIQYAGYLWTLLGIAAVLVGFGGVDEPEQRLSVFLNGAGLAVSTSVLGWLVGRLFESTAPTLAADPASAAAEDLARSMDRLKVRLEEAGASFVGSVNGAAARFGRIEADVKAASDISRTLMTELRSFSTDLNNSLRGLNEGFAELNRNVRLVSGRVVDNLKETEEGTKGLAKLLEDVEQVRLRVTALAERVEEAAAQSQRVIKRVGEFLDQVFEKRR